MTRGKILLITLNLLLCTALAGVGFSYYRYVRDTRAIVQNAIDSPPTVPAMEMLPQEDMVSIETIQEYASRYSVSVEFMQQFFDDAIVYKDENGFQYAPIDSTLPQNDYDWSYLSAAGGRLQYRPQDELAAVAGIDVSHYQGKIDWEAVRADGVEFAMIRLGYRGYGTGKLMLDERFEENIAGATEAGLKVGVYFFTQAVTPEEAREEAAFVLEHIEGYDLAYPVAVDVEYIADDARANGLDRETLTDCVAAFCEAVKAGGERAMVYANTPWLVSKLELARLTAYDVWLAQYYQKPFFPYAFCIWQYSSTGRVEGIDGDVDLNLCFLPY